jgi:hypothetical protein
MQAVARSDIWRLRAANQSRRWSRLQEDMMKGRRACTARQRMGLKGQGIRSYPGDCRRSMLAQACGAMLGPGQHKSSQHLTKDGRVASLTPKHLLMTVRSSLLIRLSPVTDIAFKMPRISARSAVHRRAL